MATSCSRFAVGLRVAFLLVIVARVSTAGKNQNQALCCQAILLSHIHKPLLNYNQLYGEKGQLCI